MRLPLVVATRNAGKARELAAIFAHAGIAVADLAGAGLPVADVAEDAVEAYPTFAENALAKARYFFGVLGRPCVADDSGLEVRALGGAPGVRSRRWARDRGEPRVDELGDDANNAVLVRVLAGERDRRARFVCAAAYCGPNGEELVAEGTVDGTITEVPRGAGGFGYDPYFCATVLGRTLAEASIEEKERVSHRGAAFRALLAQLVARPSTSD